MHRTVEILVAITILTITVASTAAHANDPLAKPTNVEAREHLSKGNKLYSVRSFEEAIVEYKAGALIESTPVWDYNLGQCYRQLGKYQDAIWHYDRFLNRGQPTGELHDAVVGFITQMKSELDQKAKTQEPTEPAPATPPATSPMTAHQNPPSLPLRHVDEAEAWYSDGVGWALAGTGVIGLAASGLLFVDAQGLYDDANANPDSKARTSLRSRGDTRQLLGTAIGIGGAGLVIAGVIKLALHPHSTTTTSLGLAPTETGLMVFGAF
jgi:tetratricopeptide (TPR) repeat protein